MYGKIKQDLQNTLEELKQQGLYKTERIITSSQSAEIEVNGISVLNFCANNYLGLANNPEVVKAAQNIMTDWGFGLSSVRFYINPVVLVLRGYFAGLVLSFRTYLEY